MRLRLIIVDDEQIIREALSEMVDYPSIGYELVAVAKNGMEAYDRIRDEYPDVVITDISMPILNGLELIERSTKTDPQINFILLSGYSEFEYAKQALRFGVRDYLLKPTSKQELIDVLLRIREEKIRGARERRHQQEEFLSGLKAPLEQCFLMEALAYQEDYDAIYRKYQGLLALSDTDCNACICSFVEESFAKCFVQDSARILRKNQVPLLFPAIYVKNSVVLILPAQSLADQEKLSQLLKGLHYPGQLVEVEGKFLKENTTCDLFLAIIGKISRFERILLLNHQGETYEIRNNPASPWRIHQLVEALLGSQDHQLRQETLNTVFAPALPLPTAKHLAISLFLSLPDTEEAALDIACDFFRRIYCCQKLEDIKKLMLVVLLRKQKKQIPSHNSANIELLKSYINQNLAKEDISLKWLAENHLFVSIGYLSKQFLKEEGIRFSDYLNRKRMEEAQRLMKYYHNDNIRDIACRVGFCSNPQYFSQVFKRYTGVTPSEYIESLKQKREVAI